MTTIAYSPKGGGALAADTLVNLGGTKYYGPKLYRLDDGSIFGGAGDSATVNDVVAWINGGRKGKPPKFGTMRGLHLTDERLFLYACKPTPTELDRRQVAAIGSGQDAALAILRTSGDLEGAVRAAMLVDDGTGGEVQTMKLTPDPPKKLSVAA